jgi:hypothetical protein
MNKLIKVGYCVAYDWKLLEYSIPSIYDFADVICLSIDKDRISWSGNSFSWDNNEFNILIEKLDPKGKMKIYEDDFHLPELKPMENEVRQRNMIAEFMGKGGWHLQLDTDEFFLNFEAFVSYLLKCSFSKQFNVSCPWITLYKQDDDGFYYIKPDSFKNIEFIQIATLYPDYKYGRRNGNFNLLTDFAILHLSWARSEAEIWEKLNNWGHKDDFDVTTYFNKWKNLNKSNYKNYSNFHHIQPEIWPRIDFISARSVNELLFNAKDDLKLPISKLDLIKSNSIWYSRFKKVFNI